MKTIHHTSTILQFSLAIFLAMMTACSQESVPTYDTATTGLDIWVGTSGGAVYESVSYNYSYSYDDGTLVFYAQINGLPTDYDRTFRLEPMGEYADVVRATMRQEDYVIRAGQIGGTYKIHFNTQALPDPTLFTTEDGIVQFRMVPNEVFSIGTENHQQFTVIMKNHLDMPDYWDAIPASQTMYIYYPMSKYFGTYSNVKFQFMIQELDVMQEWIEELNCRKFKVQYSMGSLPNYVKDDKEDGLIIISVSYALQLQQKMKQALNDYNASHDTPLTNENGYPVTF